MDWLVGCVWHAHTTVCVEPSTGLAIFPDEIAYTEAPVSNLIRVGVVLNAPVATVRL